MMNAAILSSTMILVGLEVGAVIWFSYVFGEISLVLDRQCLSFIYHL